MSRHPLSPDDLASSREIRFVNRQESNYPNLMRLCLDFNLRVLQLQRKIYSHISQRLAPTAPTFWLVSSDTQHEGFSVTPACASLQELEDYVARHQVDILHDYLFGEDQVADVG